MHCKNCKFWRRGGWLDYKSRHNSSTEEVVRENENGPIICHRNNGQNCGLCLHPSVTSDGRNSWLIDEDEDWSKEPKTPEDGVYAGCDERRAFLYVGENFGCIHFEKGELQ